MKKLMMLFVAVSMAGMVNAAAFSWKLQTGSDYSGSTVYMFNDTTAATILAICQKNDAAAWTSAFNESTSYNATSGVNARFGIYGESTGVAANDNLVFVIVQGDITEGSTYTVVNDYSVPASSVYEPPASGESVTIKLSDIGIAGTGEFVSVPEPTSGVLLLLGMAGLVLKRKRV